MLMSSCAKMNYLIEQGVGQIGLEWHGVSNQDVLADKSISAKDKQKIELILKAKSFFFDYFNLKQTGIYEQTTFLDQEAVTYLVIVSPPDQIKAIKTHFPIMGSFPYLGFFKKSSAIRYKKKKEDEGFHTFMRDVYAYSTLNQWIFDDNILSSFFKLKDHQLVELIFHELVHTVIFVKNDVAFNENLAQFIAKELVIEFFDYDKAQKDKLLQAALSNEKLRVSIISHTKKLNKLYKAASEPKQILSRYLRDDFFPSMKEACEKLNLKHCWPLKEKWNNARFAAFGTYASKQNKIQDLYKKTGKKLKEYFVWIIKRYDSFEGEVKFLDYLNTGI
jgi:predicted aminopeptidase